MAFGLPEPRQGLRDDVAARVHLNEQEMYALIAACEHMADQAEARDMPALEQLLRQLSGKLQAELYELQLIL